MQSRLFLFNSLGFFVGDMDSLLEDALSTKNCAQQILECKRNTLLLGQIHNYPHAKVCTLLPMEFLSMLAFHLNTKKVLSVFPSCSSQTSSWYILQADFLKTLLNKFTVQQCCTILIVGIKLFNILLGAHLFI